MTAFGSGGLPGSLLESETNVVRLKYSGPGGQVRVGGVVQLESNGSGGTDFSHSPLTYTECFSSALK